MSRHPAIVHAVPLDASGLHVPAGTCRCAPIQASDLLEPGRLVLIHRHVPAVPDPPRGYIIQRRRTSRVTP